jgi:DNA-binding IclR family transcriptional regulator
MQDTTTTDEQRNAEVLRVLRTFDEPTSLYELARALCWPLSTTIETLERLHGLGAARLTYDPGLPELWSAA